MALALLDISAPAAWSVATFASPSRAAVAQRRHASERIELC